MELAPYFEAQHLEFTGISRTNYEQLGGQLPEGLYRFSFTVYDANRPDRQLSLPGQTVAWLALSEPPLLNQPFCGTEITIDDGQQFIVFQWSPVGTSPNNANSVEYEFTLTEIRPTGRDPFEAWRTTEPIYRTTTTENSIVYDQDEPLLIPGLSYVWRVQAIDINGRESFREQGYSKVCEFKIAEVPLTPATNVIATPISSDKGRVSWDLSPEAEGYEIQYRRSGDASNQWFSSREPAQEGGSIDGEIVIPGLAPDREYEIRVGSRRGGFVSSWSNSAYFSTLAQQQLACGDEINFRPFENFQPLEFLYRGDVIETGGGMRVTVTASTGSNGSFSGKGVVTPGFIGVPIKVKFTNIVVDQDYRLTGGVITGLRNPKLQEFIDAWDQDDEDDDQNGDGEGDNTGDNDTPPDPDIVIDGVIDEVVFDEETDEIVITDADGNVTRHQQESDEDGEPTDTIIEDSEGNRYLVDADGNVTKEDSSDASTINSGPPSADLDRFGVLVKNTLLNLRDGFQNQINSLEFTFNQNLEQVNTSWGTSLDNGKIGSSPLGLSTTIEVLISIPAEEATSNYKTSSALGNHIALIDELKQNSLLLIPEQNKWTLTNDFLEETNFYALLDELKEHDESIDENNIEQILLDKINNPLQK